MTRPDISTAPVSHLAVAPPTVAQRQSADWGLVQAEQVDIIRHEPFSYEFKGSRHLLVASERAERYDGETLADGLPRFIDPLSPLLSSELRFTEVKFKPRLFFFDLDIWETALKLKAQLANSCRSQKAYVEALGIALAHELTRMNEDTPSLASDARGGLPHWQQKKLTQYIEVHLADEVSLLSLAQLAQLSPYHFSRAFKQSFGMPPHQYLTSRRIERAKSLLAERKLSVTEIGFDVGFSETSSFIAAFRKVTGETPTEYRRSLA